MKILRFPNAGNEKSFFYREKVRINSGYLRIDRNDFRLYVKFFLLFFYFFLVSFIFYFLLCSENRKINV
jgi:hypothetical protein